MFCYTKKNNILLSKSDFLMSDDQTLFLFLRMLLITEDFLLPASFGSWAGTIVNQLFP